MKVESATGQSLVRITTLLSDGSLTMTDMVKILHPAIRGGGNDVTETEVAKIIYESGVAQSMVAVGEVLSNVLSGSRGSDEESESEEKKTEEVTE